MTRSARSRILTAGLCLSACLAGPGSAAEVAVPPPVRTGFPSDAPLPPPRPLLPAPAPPAALAPSVPPPASPVRPATAAAPPGEPVATPSDATCLPRLQAMAVDAEGTAIGPQPDARCTVADAVRLTGLRLADGTAVAFPDRPTIACATGTVFATFVRDLLAPLAKGTYGSPVTAVWTGPGLECRTRDHLPGAKLSAHGQGLAVDVAQVRLADGRVIEVGRPKAALDQGFESAALAGGCGYFHTALGPGADAFHETHWHFDLLSRGAKGEAKLCQ